MVGAVLGAGIEVAVKISSLKKASVSVPFHRILHSVMRTHFSFFYFVSFHLVRYYLVWMLVAGTVVPGLWPLGVAMLLYAGLIDYVVKGPRLLFVTFLFFYTLEHLCYQAGVMAGCVRARTFSPYRSTVKRRLVLAGIF